MTTHAIPLEGKMSGKSRSAKGMKIGFAAAIAVAGAYSIGRLFINRNSGFRQYKKRMEEWLKPRLESLSETLGATGEMASQISEVVQSASRMMLCLGQKAKRSKPEKRDLLEIILETRLLKMKAKIHKLLNITEASQAEALHSFYEELRGWVIPAAVTER